MTKYALPVSASWNPNFYIPSIPCRPLTDRELDQIVRNFGQGAADAKTMGIDGVYLHGHEGYLIDQLTNTAFNHRKLGKYTDWQLFGINIVKEMRKRTGPWFPIMYRIDLSCALEETYGERFEIPKPDDLIFISWFSGGEVFRSGCCYNRGLGKIFYFRPGHEEYPTFWREDISRIIKNAVDWAAPNGGPRPTLGHFDALENVPDKFAGKSDAERKHEDLRKPADSVI